MAVGDGTWIMKGVDWNHPECIHTIEELEQYMSLIQLVDKVLCHEENVL